MCAAACWAIRPLAVGRKNYLFAGSDEGGHRAAIIHTLIETSRLNDVDPEAWLGDVIRRMPITPTRRSTNCSHRNGAKPLRRLSPHSGPRPSHHAYGLCEGEAYSSGGGRLFKLASEAMLRS